MGEEAFLPVKLFVMDAMVLKAFILSVLGPTPASQDCSN